MTDDWRELMPNHEAERFSGVYDALELVLYADPEDFTIRQGLYVSYALILLPPLVVGPLVLVGLLLTGQLTVQGIGAALQSAQASSSATSPFAVDPVAIGRALLTIAYSVPICLGVTMCVKTILKSLAKLREVNR